MLVHWAKSWRPWEKTLARFERWQRAQATIAIWQVDEKLVLTKLHVLIEANAKPEFNTVIRHFHVVVLYRIMIYLGDQHLEIFPKIQIELRPWYSCHNFAQSLQRFHRPLSKIERPFLLRATLALHSKLNYRHITRQGKWASVPRQIILLSTRTFFVSKLSMSINSTTKPRD